MGVASIQGLKVVREMDDEGSRRLKKKGHVGVLKPSVAAGHWRDNTPLHQEILEILSSLTTQPPAYKAIQGLRSWLESLNAVCDL